jgi:hypothetical protein
MKQALFAGIDLHSNNVMIGIVDQSGRRQEGKIGGRKNRVASQHLTFETHRFVRATNSTSKSSG